MVAASQVYMSRDENGNVVFSDQPSDGATIHEVKELQTVPALVTPAANTEEDKAPTSETNVEYTSLSIISPSNKHTVPTGHAGNIEVSGVLSPSLQATDTIYLLSNKAVLRQGRQTTFSLNNLPRGEHTLRLVVRDQAGKDLISSNPVTIYVQRASILNR